MSKAPHTPILVDAIVSALAVRPSDVILDATIGFGGHAAALLPSVPTGRYIGIDRDPHALAYCRTRFKDCPQLSLVHDRFGRLDAVLAAQKLGGIQAGLVDLGMSSFQLDHPDRGFSFQVDAPLDMRMNPEGGMQTAADLLNSGSADDLVTMFGHHTDLNGIHRFVDVVVQRRDERAFSRTPDLLSAIKKGFFFRNKRAVYIRTCTQVFQALRMAVNDELGELQALLTALETALLPGGRFAVLTFHSIEDRFVKRFVATSDALCFANKKVIKANQSEIRRNSRSKSAKLRLIERV